MPRFQDATGYLLELRNTINQGWFSAICDMALNSHGRPPSPEQLEELWGYLHNSATYTPSATLPSFTCTATATNTSPPPFLEQVSGFNGYKKLSPNLRLDLSKNVTLIFGTNGSGKSSLCQALKVLASPDAPKEPLRNVRAATPRPPSFSYRFRGVGTNTVWTEAVGFGSQSNIIKYFDSAVALKHVTDNLRPEVSVEVSAFRLEAFDYVRTFLTEFQKYAGQRINYQEQHLSIKLEALKSALSSTLDVTVAPFSDFTPTNANNIDTWLNGIAVFDTQLEEQLITCQLQHNELVSASSEEGLQSLRALHSLFTRFEAEVSDIARQAEMVSLRGTQLVEAQLTQKTAALNELSEGVFPKNSDPVKQQALVAAAESLLDLSSASSGITQCPLCRQTLNDNSAALFRHYHNHLTSTLQEEVRSLNDTLTKSRQALETIRSFKLGDFSACESRLPQNFTDNLIKLITAVQDSIPEQHMPISSGNADTYDRRIELRQFYNFIIATKEGISSAIQQGTENKSALEKSIKSASDKMRALQAHKAVDKHRQEILSLHHEITQFVPLAARHNSTDYPTILRRLTNKGKDAHRELVLNTFEQQLNSEYIALCGKTLEQMGVRFMARGKDVIVSTHVGESPVHRVLSEGEQKVHALAVFMCEANTSNHPVLVFDDPVTSFDYNYVSNFCERLRDHIRDNASVQIIILTHSWDFFINMQSTINRSDLGNRLSVQVLEGCSTVSAYVEEWSSLCQQIESIILTSEEITTESKERVSGLMRRLIETLTNKFVFNGQRHQYKAKAPVMSAFTTFTKIVPLLPSEAETLRDLYANLSPAEHDDIRNFYSTKSRGQFEYWYREILSIKAAVADRRPE